MKKNPKTFRNIAAASLALALTLPGVASAAETSPAEAAYAPVRDAAAKLGVQVRWDQAAHTVTLTKGDTVLVLTPGKAQGLLNGKTVQVGGTVQLVSGKTLVPAAFLSGIFSETSGTGDGMGPVASKNAADLFLQALEAGNGAKAAEYMTPAFQKVLPVQAINALWGNYEQMYGKTSSNPPVQTEQTDAVYHNVSYMLQLGQVPVNVTLRLNADGKVDDMYLGPVSAAGYQKPSYDNPAAYTEQEVRIGNGEMALPGTLTLPQGEGPFPAVVLVHGSGPQDRDSSMGAAKPLRDLAVGLAAKGIAVLRYDKVTYEHTFKVASDPKFTLKKESVDDAVSAVKLLKRTSKIDAGRIFVAGHSQGGFAMPLIIDADQDHDVAGAILLSGPSMGFADTLIDQQQELVARVKKLGQDAAPYEQQAAAWNGIAKLVNDPQYTVDHMPENFPVSPAYWWFEQKNYKPVDLAAKQQTPMLILQGENDWQVTMKQFNGWKNALQTRSDVEFKSYPKMNHVLADYDGLSIGTEYAAPSNVSAELISDMAAWIQKHK